MIAYLIDRYLFDIQVSLINNCHHSVTPVAVVVCRVIVVRTCVANDLLHVATLVISYTNFY